MRVLIVDDDPASRELVATVMQDVGWQVTLAVDGPSALGEFVKDRFDLMITDNTMPGMTGTELARLIAAAGADELAIWPTPPIIMISGDMELPDEIPHICVILHKPFSLMELQAAAERLTKIGPQ